MNKNQLSVYVFFCLIYLTQEICLATDGITHRNSAGVTPFVNPVSIAGVKMPLEPSFSSGLVTTIDGPIEGQGIIRPKVLQAHYKNVLFYTLLPVMAILLIILLVYRRNALKLKKLNHDFELKQKELIDHHHKLNDLYKDQQKLITILAHDLNAPFDRIKGLAFILFQSENLNEEQKEVIRKIEHTAENSKNLVEDIIYSFSQDEDSLELKREQIDTAPFFEEIIETHQHYARKKQITLHSDIEAFSVVTNASYVSRIIDNLLSNAIKFTPQSGEVFVELVEKGELFCFSIRDTGPGIAPGEQQLMFKRFQKLSNKPTGGEHSTGLGLSITKSLVEKLNGKIEVESKPGSGTKFTVCLPMEMP